MYMSDLDQIIIIQYIFYKIVRPVIIHLHPSEVVRSADGGVALYPHPDHQINTDAQRNSKISLSS